MHDFLALIGGIWLVCVLLVAALVLLSLEWERRDKKARAREQEDRDQAAHVRRFAACRAAGTLQLHNANAPATGVQAPSRDASVGGSQASRRTESLTIRRIRSNG